MADKEIRLLHADEIECRVSMVTETGMSLLLYKDARVDQRILDETFTTFGWKRSHQVIDGNLYCTVEVWDTEKSQWIGKQDVGKESYTEKEKGQASDSFKRACVNWGIGRELYSAPFIWVPVEKVNIQKIKEKYVTKDRFQVTDINYNDKREIIGLQIQNQRGEIIYSYYAGKRKEEAQSRSKQTKGNSTEVRTKLAEKAMQNRIDELQRELDRTGVSWQTVLRRYGLSDINQMTAEQYRDAMSGLKKSRSAAEGRRHKTMISCDGILGLFKEAASKRIEQVLLAEWREKKDFYQREGQKRDELLGRLNDVEKQLFEEYMEMVLEGNNEKEMAIYQNGFLDGLYVANKIQNLDKIERRK